MKRAVIKLLVFLTAALFAFCQDSQAIKLKQYQIQGRSLYLQHCSNCHQPDGEGLERLYPPVAGSDYMTARIDGTICLIRHGISGEIMVNGQSYNNPMPANSELSTLQIAEITTYLFNSWGKEEGIITRNAVENSLKNCD